MARSEHGEWKHCAVPDCTGRLEAQGYCGKHYKWLQRRGLLKSQVGGVTEPRPRPEPIKLPVLPPGATCENSPEPLWDDRLDGYEESTRERYARHRMAFKLCSLCPVKQECLDARGDSAGIWGGVLFEGKYDRTAHKVVTRRAS